MASKTDVYQKVTDTIVKSLEKGTIPWEKPWRNAAGEFELQKNINSKRPYRGINQLLLTVYAMDAGYELPLWGTYKGLRKIAYKQWAKDNKVKIEKSDLDNLTNSQLGRSVEPTENVQAFLDAGGGGVKAGEKSFMVVFWKLIDNKKHDPTDKNSSAKIPLMRYYNVFNVDQCEGIDLAKPIEPDEDEMVEFDPITDCEQIWENFKDKPEVKENGGRACYKPLVDEIGMPKRKLFKDGESYYNTLFHEGVHSTGHESRLGRVKDWTTFGSEPYSREELVAEIGGAMICGVAGIMPQTIENTERYCKHWAAKLKDNKKEIVQASAAAQKAADYILGVTFDKDNDSDKVEAK